MKLTLRIDVDSIFPDGIQADLDLLDIDATRQAYVSTLEAHLLRTVGVQEVEVIDTPNAPQTRMEFDPEPEPGYRIVEDFQVYTQEEIERHYEAGQFWIDKEGQ